MKIVAKLTPTDIAKKPIVGVVGRGSNSYLWVGNDDYGNAFCLGWIGFKASRTMARRILKLTSIKHRRK